MLVSGSVALGQTETVIIIVPVKFWFLNRKKLGDGVHLTGLLCWFNVPKNQPQKQVSLVDSVFFPSDLQSLRSDDSDRANPRSSNTFFCDITWEQNGWDPFGQIVVTWGQPLHYMVFWGVHALKIGMFT